MTHIDQVANYTLRLDGCLGAGLAQELADWFGAVRFENSHYTMGEGSTTLSDVIADQAGLVGLIRHLHGMGVVLLSVERHALITA
jgi:hypothetical protein